MYTNLGIEMLRRDNAVADESFSSSASSRTSTRHQWSGVKLRKTGVWGREKNNYKIYLYIRIPRVTDLKSKPKAVTFWNKLSNLCV